MKGGYILVDLQNVVIKKADSPTANKLNGIYKKVKDAVNSGKIVVFNNIGKFDGYPSNSNLVQTLSPTLVEEYNNFDFIVSKNKTDTVDTVLQVYIQNDDKIVWRG